jgi:hypothetical protein
MRCTICAHPRRAQLELGMILGTSMRVLAKRFECSSDALQRHGKRHLTPTQRAAILTAQKPCNVDLEALQRSEGEGILSQLVAQRARLQGHIEQAIELGDPRLAIMAEARITANLELVAKLLGQLIQRHETTHTSILLSPDYIRLRQILVETLRPCGPIPRSQRRWRLALHAIESDAAKTISESKRALVIEHRAAP